MKPFLQLCWQGTRHAVGAVFSLAVWSLWLALAVVLGVLIWCAVAREMAVPGFVLRALEDRLAASQLQATFGHTSFDPSGRILVENVRILSPSFKEPLVTVRAAYARLDPWALLAGRFEPLEFRLSGVSLFVPAMLSASGHAEPLVSDLDATLVPGEHEVDVRLLTTRLGRLVITARGAVHTAVWQHGRGAPLPVADFISKDYPRLSRQLADYARRLDLLDEPRLDVDLVPSDTRGAIVTAAFTARGLNVSEPFALQAVNLSAATRFPVAGETVVKAQFDLSADELRLPRDAVAQGVHARVRGTLRPEQRTFDPEETAASVNRVTGEGLTAAPVVADATRRDGPLRAAIVTRLAGAPVAVSGVADLAEKSAHLHLDTAPTPALLAALSPFAHRDLPALLRLSIPPEVTAEIELATGWKFASVDGRFDVRQVVARNVALDEVSGHVTYAGTRLEATDVLLHQGENIARGSYTMDTATLDYRFLLDGRLRPAGIDGWFTEWWPHFFQNFDFTAAPPAADVDVQGRWGRPDLSSEFIAVDAVSPIIRGVAFDRVRTRLFIRADFFTDALDFSVAHRTGGASGSFTRRYDPVAKALRRMDVDVTSTMDEQDGARIFGREGLDIVEPFHFSTPPHLRIKGHLDGPAGPEGEHQKLHIEGESGGAFTLFDFPLSDLSFNADLSDDDLTIDRVSTTFAGGKGAGRVTVTGRRPDRKLDFNYDLKGANLAQSITTLDNFLNRNQPASEAAKGDFMEKAADIRLDLSAAATGKYQDLYSFQGKGHAELVGPELGQVRLLGLLSQLLNFTSLRFTRLQTDFQIDGRKLVFPEVKVTGANSEIDAKGAYALDEKALDFNAKVFPLGESKTFLPQVVNAVLSPISEILEVKLTGSLSKPEWAFVHSPVSFLRNLNPAKTPDSDKPGAEKPEAGAPPAPPAPTEAAAPPDPKP
ncbi:MAG TPA: AsmA-like C-terminal region-containing protein [Opitutaceae bacterium]|nr:AsmA-like C-terminal region-containing protein [Opitutaceae bacterium]